ncbi:uncharacterized protein METZ01_LOCUS415858, partial [marine metagenome]
MKIMRIIRYFGYLVSLVLLIGLVYLTNLFLMKPFSIDHYLAKNLIVDFSDTPEGLTYIGLVDRFNWITNHLSELSIVDLEDISQELIRAKERKAVLLSYKSSELSDEQEITRKIALFDLENEINQGENFPFHSYPINQIGGQHLNLVEFMTDIHPLRSISEANYYIDRLNLFDDFFKAGTEVLEEQRKAGIFPPEFVFHHVIRQLKEFLDYSF